MPVLLTGIFAVPETVPVSARLGSEDRNLCLLRAQFVEASSHGLPGIGYAPYVPIRDLDFPLRPVVGPERAPRAADHLHATWVGEGV